MSHAASVLPASRPFEEAAILTVDGVGEWATASFGVGRGSDITLFKEIRFPHSLGLLYSAFTYYLGFKVNSAEYKVMGLAPYGKPVHFDRIMKEMVHLNEDGSFKLNMKYFSYDYGLHHDERRLQRVLRRPAAQAGDLDGRARVRHRGLRAEGVRGGRAADGALHPQGDGAQQPLHGGRRRAQLRGERPRRPRDARSRTSSCSPRPATRAARSASRTTSTTRSHKQPRARGAGRTPTSAPSTRTTRSRATSTRAGATYETLPTRGAR